MGHYVCRPHPHLRRRHSRGLPRSSPHVGRRAIVAFRRLGTAVVAAWAFLTSTSPLRGQEPVSVDLAAELRLRTESWSNFGFRPDQDDVFLLGRLLLGADLRLGDHFRAYLQARSSLSTERDLPGGRRPIDADVVGRQNVIGPSVGVGLEPVRGLNVAIRGYRFWRSSLQDALYNAGGAVVRAPGEGASRSVGSELDFTTAYRFGGHLTGLVGYSRFFAGRFIEETGPSDDTGFLYASLTARLSN